MKHSPNPSTVQRTSLRALSLITVIAAHPLAQAAEHGVTSGMLLRQSQELSRALRPNDDGTAQPSSSAEQGDSDELQFPVQDFVFDGELSADERARVEAFIAPLRGRQLTLSALQTLRAELTELLYHDGESLVRVLLPQQTVEGGIVHFAIVRGRIEKIVVANGSDVATGRIESILHGKVLSDPTLRDIDSRMRLLRALPGVGGVDATLSPGKYAGGTVVTVAVAPGPALYGMVNADNAGSPEAGGRRVGVIGGINNPFGRGDRLEAMVYATPNAMQTHESAGGQTRLARVSYDTPFGAGASRVGAAVSDVGYRLGGAFDGLGKGSAQVASVYATRPIWRTRASSLDVSAELDRKRLRDERFDSLLESRRDSTVASVRADGSGIAGQGRWRTYQRYGAALSYGAIAMDDIDRSGNAPSVQRRANFVKFEPTAGVVVAPVSSLQLSAQLRGQLASRSLDGSERMTLGGPGAVRAYGLSEAAVDDGAIISLEASHELMPNTRVTAFYDGAAGRYRSAFGLPSRTVNLQGAGVGISWNWKGMQAQVSLARPIGRAKDTPKDDQVWVTVGKSF